MFFRVLYGVIIYLNLHIPQDSKSVNMKIRKIFMMFHCVFSLLTHLTEQFSSENVRFIIYSNCGCYIHIKKGENNKTVCLFIYYQYHTSTYNATLLVILFKLKINATSLKD